MDRKFLTDLGLEKEVVDKVLNQNGAEITALKTQLSTKDTEIKTLRDDLISANGKIANLEKVDVQKLQNDLIAERNGRKKDRQDWELRATLTGAGCKDPDYLIFKLGGKVKFAEDGSLEDKDALLESCKKDYAHMFEAEQPPTDTGSLGNFTRNRNDRTPDSKNPYTKSGWNLTEQMRLETTEPEKAKRLREQADTKD